MIFNYNGHSEDGGVYCITNTLNGRIYIGSTSRFRARWTQHCLSLRSNKQKNRFMQRDFNKCLKKQGHTDFLAFDVLGIEGDKNKRLELEQTHLDAALGTKCYNVQKSTKAFTHSPRTMSFRQVIGEKSKEMWQKPGFREKHRAAVMTTYATPEYKARLSENTKRMWLNPECRAKLVETHKVHSKAMWAQPGHRQKMAESRSTPECKAKTRATRLSGGVDKNGRPKIRIIPGLVSPDGTVYRDIVSVQAFAREHNLNRGWLNQLVLGKKDQHKGWKLLTAYQGKV